MFLRQVPCFLLKAISFCIDIDNDRRQLLNSTRCLSLFFSGEFGFRWSGNERT